MEIWSEKREAVIVKPSELEAEVTNDPCQSSANIPLDGFEPQTATLIEITGSIETSPTTSVVASSTSTVETGSPSSAV